MKTFRIAFVAGACLLAAVAASHGQGDIHFQNNTSQTPVTFGDVTGTIYAPDAGQRVWGPAGTFEYGLYLGPAGSTDLSQMTLVDTTLSPVATSATDFRAGNLNGDTLNSTTGGNVSGFSAGVTYADEVVGWTAVDGSTVAQALASGDPNLLVGYSEIGQITVNPLPIPPGQVFGTAGGGEIGTGIVLNETSESSPVPDQTSTLALVGLGIAASLMFRHRYHPA